MKNSKIKNSFWRLSFPVVQMRVANDCSYEKENWRNQSSRFKKHSKTRTRRNKTTTFFLFGYVITKTMEEFL